MPSLVYTVSDEKKRLVAKRAMRRSILKAARREAKNADMHTQYQSGWSADWQAWATPVNQHFAINIIQYLDPGQAPATYSTYFVAPGDACPPHYQDLSCASVEAGFREGFDERVQQMAQFESEAAGYASAAKVNEDSLPVLALDAAGLFDQADSSCGERVPQPVRARG